MSYTIISPKIEYRVLKYLFTNFIILPVLAYIASRQIFISDLHDYIEYGTWYETINFENIFGENAYEIGYSFLASFAKLALGISYDNFAFLIILFSLSLKLKAFQNTTSKSTYLFLIYLFLFFNAYESIALRSAIALSILLFGISINIISSIYYRAALLCVLISIHISFAIFLPILIFPQSVLVKFNVKVYFFIFFSVLLAAKGFVLFLADLIPRLGSYVLVDNHFFTLLIIPKLIVCILLLIFTSKYKDITDGELITKHLANFALLASTLTLEFNVVGARFLDYAILIYIFYIFLNNKYRKMKTSVLLISGYILYDGILKYTSLYTIFL